ncbi:uncharacterized protein L3040_006905 [Drepanopeziza brunnea f. sp. 'multigermtubi']|uniref:uncharacterized protein n=1 Tax=Drepanopeziza brunnea f. sp. 'multigermtubi' TaxID=698441 RepID=UPI00238E74C5|nr:hypothetical protein L3040_006905 [Drepanopeziza brunnea f. sp. 'multigermtubi']
MTSTVPPRNFSYPNQFQPPHQKLRCSRSFSLPNMNPNNASNSGAQLNLPKTRNPALISPEPDRSQTQRPSTPARRPASPHPPRAAAPPRKDSSSPRPRSRSGRMRSKGRAIVRRIFTPTSPTATQRASLMSPPPSPPSPAALGVDRPGQPVLVEYLPLRPRFPRRGAVVYLAPGDSRASFVERARLDGLRGEGLFGLRLGRDDGLSLYVCWNQGGRSERVDSEVVGEREWRRVVDLMQVRGWTDRFQLWFTT